MAAYQYLIIVNPIAGNIDKNPLYDFLADEQAISPFTYKIYKTTGKNDEKALKKFLNTHQTKCIVAAGGDGTVNLAVRVLLDTKIPLGIIPLGSANGMARELNILRGVVPLRSLITREKVRGAWSVIRQSNTRKLDLVKINDQYYSLHLSDIGLNAKIVKRFENDNIRGYLGYTRQFFRELPQREKISYRITANDRKHKGHAYMIVIANASRYGSGTVINSRGAPDDGKFELCIVKDINIKGLVKALFSIFRKNVQYQKKDLRVISCSRASVILKRKQVLQVDGEIIGEQDHLSLEILPEAVQVLV
jgi:diacylglycerol kinase family enzyme